MANSDDTQAQAARNALAAACLMLVAQGLGDTRVVIECIDCLSGHSGQLADGRKWSCTPEGALTIGTGG